MQGWTGCSSLTTTTTTGAAYGICLKDTRDNKAYEVRKFADGKCWMVDNLRYGGSTTASGSVTDYCATITTWSITSGSDYGYTTGTKNPNWHVATSGSGTLETLYGNCRNPALGAPYYSGSDASNICLNNTTCGYLYYWQAAMQHPSAYYNSTYTGSTPAQGICPTGWHVPSGNTSGQFAALDTAVGGSGYERGCDPATAPDCKFWQPEGNFKGVYSGMSTTDGSLSDQGSIGWWWSSTPYTTYNAYDLNMDSGGMSPGSYNSYRFFGMAVRCQKD
jgi:uncharacterized protein (TIGR02145 family)